jgi:glutamate formiminotransferase/formiminotetrahydrofolate cyclodeaminase
VGALCARSAVVGAHLNVKINAASLKDEVFKTKILKEAAEIEAAALKEEAEILAIVDRVING